MPRIKTTPAFEAWLRSLTYRALSKVLNRMRHMECGNFGDCRPVGEGVSESRIHYGPGYRLYFLRSGEAIHVLLLGGSKATQTGDIRKAQAMAKDKERRNVVTITLSDFDVVDYLVDSKMMACYLTDALEEGGVPLFLKACGDVARARGMTDVAADAGLTRASLYKALGEDGNPTMTTVSRVLDSLGFKMVIRPGSRKQARDLAKQPRRAGARVMRTEASVARTRLAQDRVPYAARKAPAKQAKGQGAASKRKR